MNIKEDYNLRENADIVALAIDTAKSWDSTELKQWFDKKYKYTRVKSFLWGCLIGLITAMCAILLWVWLINLNNPKDTKMHPTGEADIQLPKDYYDTDISKTTIKAHKH